MTATNGVRWFAVALAVVLAQPAVAVSQTVTAGSPSELTSTVRAVRKFETRVRVHCAPVVGSPSRAFACHAMPAPAVSTVVYLDMPSHLATTPVSGHTAGTTR